MTGFYYVIDAIRKHLKNNGFINTVTTGDIFEVDLAKQTIYPYCHIIVNSAIPKEQTITTNISVIFMDLVDISKTEITDAFENNDNLLDVLNTQLELANRLITDLRRGLLFGNLLQLEGDANCEPFTDRFENKVAGWTVTFDLNIPNDMTIC